jgi:hypothetical protein
VTSSDLLSALGPVVAALDALGVRHYVGGSLASSAHGVPRASIDADVVADLGPEHVAPLVRRLEAAYYVDENRARAAVEARRSFNLIHLETMFKVDVFASKRRPYDREAVQRARPEALDDSSDSPRFMTASREDIVLAKLEWFRAGGEVSERQWGDVVGVMRPGWPDLERDYLRRWAVAIGVTDLLDRALAEAAPGGTDDG